MTARTAYGLPLSSTPEVATAWDGYLEALGSFAADEEARARGLAEEDPGFGLGRAVHGLTAMLNGTEGVDVAAEAAAARAGRADHDWERSLRDVLCRMLDGGPWAAYEDLLRHGDAFPGDLVGLEYRGFLQSASTAPGAREAVHAACRAALAAVGPSPSAYSGLGFMSQELGRLDEAWEWNERLLALRPAHILGAHVAAHVHFERAEHEAGLAWLDDWFAVGDRSSAYFGHLRWHAGLHQLATGDDAAALATLHACGHATGSYTQVSDACGLALRCQFAGLVPAGESPADEGLEARIATFGEEPVLATAFGFFQVLTLAARADADALRRYAAAASGWTAPGSAELLPPLASAFAELVEGSYAAAADGLLGLEPRFGRFGGSHAQREIVEDALLETLLRAGRPEEALPRLDARLDRRDSRADRVRRARAVSLLAQPGGS